MGIKVGDGACGPTQAQREARTRNWRIRRVRAFHAQGGVLDPDLGDRVREIADEQLARLGAETEAVRRARWLAEVDENYLTGKGKGMPF